MVLRDRLGQVVGARFAVVCHAHQAIGPRVGPKVLLGLRNPGPTAQGMWVHITVETDHEKGRWTFSRSFFQPARDGTQPHQPDDPSELSCKK
jgi:hypothetical protein